MAYCQEPGHPRMRYPIRRLNPSDCQRRLLDAAKGRLLLRGSVPLVARPS